MESYELSVEYNSFIGDIATTSHVRIPIVLGENIHETVKRHFTGRGPRIEVVKIAVESTYTSRDIAPNEDIPDPPSGCPGCVDGVPVQPNQLAHMEPGGCLWDGEW